MLYREAGQFKSSYATDTAIFPIRQDRIGMALILLVAFVGVPLLASPYLFSAILIPFLILSLAALGLNILTGYAGQLSLGSAAFMAVGAFASYNFMLRVPGIPLLVAFAGGGVTAAAVGHRVRPAEPAHPRLLPRRRHAGGAVLHPLGAHQDRLVHQLQPVGRDHRAADGDPRPHVRHAAGEVPAHAHDRVPDGARGQEHGARATSAANGWRSATWTSPRR